MAGWTPPRADVKWDRNGALNGRSKLKIEKPKPPVKLTYFRKKNATQPKKAKNGAFFGRPKQVCGNPNPSVTHMCLALGLDSGHTQAIQGSPVLM